MMRDLWADIRWFLQQRFVLATLVLGLVVRLYWSAALPLVNDEAYYWDWGRTPALSYFDHPAFVGWISYLAKGLPGTLSARGLVPWLHALTCLVLGAVVRQTSGDRESVRTAAWLVILLAQVVPFFNLGGCLLLPDAGIALWISLALYGCLRVMDAKSFSVGQAIWVGLWFGLAGCAKYHAAPLAAGALGYVLWCRRGEVRQEWVSWVMLVITGLVAVSPVLIWNGQHDLVSFRFQVNHGFGGRTGISWQPAMQTMVAQLLLFTPVYVVGVLSWAWHTVWRGGRAAKLALAMAAPLAILLWVTSFYKQTLPHWMVPSLIVCVPFVAVYFAEQRAAWIKYLVRNVYLLGGLVIVVATIFSLRGARAWLVADVFKNSPGSLGPEFTMWEAMGDYFAGSEGQALWNRYAFPPAGPGCPATPLVAGLRWYWTAQMAYYMPGQPRTVNLDPDYLSYYSFRDGEQNVEKCPIIILGSRKHLDEPALDRYVSLARVMDFQLPGFEDQPLFIAFGLGKKLPIWERDANGNQPSF